MVRNQTIYNLQARERERELFCKFYYQSSAIFCLKIGHCNRNYNFEVFNYKSLFDVYLRINKAKIFRYFFAKAWLNFFNQGTLKAEKSLTVVKFI